MAHAAMPVEGSSVDCQGEPVGQESNNHATNQDGESSTATRAEFTSDSDSTIRREKVGVATELAESAEKVGDDGSGEATVGEHDGECRAKDEGERGEEEGEGMELGEKGEDRSATEMETDMQGEVEGAHKTDDKFSTGKDKVHVHYTVFLPRNNCGSVFGWKYLTPKPCMHSIHSSVTCVMTFTNNWRLHACTCTFIVR